MCALYTKYVRWIFYSYRRSAADNLLILLEQVWNLALT
jgi:hypothetical protein